MKLVKDLNNGQMQAVSDFQLNREENQQIYKKLVLASYLTEPSFAACGTQPKYELKVRINGGERQFQWSECDSADNKKFTEIAKLMIGIVESGPIYKAMEGAQ